MEIHGFSPFALQVCLTRDAVKIPEFALYVVPLQDGTAAGTRLGQSHVEVTGIREGLSRHGLERQHLMHHEVWGEEEGENQSCLGGPCEAWRNLQSRCQNHKIHFPSKDLLHAGVFTIDVFLKYLSILICSHFLPFYLISI